MVLYQLSRPISYLAIHDPSKWKIDWVLPICCSLATLVILFTIPIRPSIFGTSGILWQISGLLQILPGFYIASLAAIATFNKNNMDEYMPELTPTVTIRIGDHACPIKLTRRRMLSLMFGYLTFLSLLLFLTIVLVNMLAPNVKLLLPASFHKIALGIFVAIYGLLFWHMIAVTLFGLYQLSDRMHQPDQG
jgi:hypothetical protein